ncbi:MAG: 4-(cytidine 5'-diphospho)-2-C-methyl-D-erythritol kinase, partial [Desulfobacteraceae bacterium]|nr:4-(cytidine 5'-diphospho)-2-C-methyl-D-erythritol kinase [Desulfobacteraceae bacterium]
HNDLENAALELYPDILHTREEMESVLSEKVCMTGSGSSLFVFFDDYVIAENAYSLLSNRFEGSLKKVILTSFKA